jgi:hypothetical protein
MLGLFDAQIDAKRHGAGRKAQIRQLAWELSRLHGSGHAIHHAGSLVLVRPWVAVKGIVHEPAHKARPGKGRPPSIDAAWVRKMKAQGIGPPREIA